MSLFFENGKNIFVVTINISLVFRFHCYILLYMNDTKKHIVILGAGFGGVHTYKALPSLVKKNCIITIIDQRNFFLFTPLLVEVAGSSLDQHNIVEPIRDIISPQHTFIQSMVLSVDSIQKKILLTDQEISYNILVSALGSTTHFFGVPGAQEYGYILKDLDDAVSLRNRFIDVFEEASTTLDEEHRKKLLKFVIVGGGPTGVELAGEISGLFFNTFQKQFRTISFDDVHITLVNSSPEILKMFNACLRNYAAKSLKKENIRIFNNICVTEVRPDGIVTKEGDLIPAHTIIWTAGVKANCFEKDCGSFLSNCNRIIVDDYLRAKNTKDIFIIGDMALFPSEDGRGLPMTAQIAKQQGICTAKNIKRLLYCKPLLPFVYHKKGLLVSLGSYNAIAEIKGLFFKGIFAWFIWRTIYVFNFASWKKRFRIMFDWTINLFSCRDTTRL